ncbi:uncharacterized protein LOC107680493 [Sinocyclocheilus anshuiensis]|uniref:uncharacterized protein LOC107680493 n=1 Tax=Sinocyclocheilus anshuiensis TaxID=1608454 RepID=UPI0007B913B8|nr:PREDICTED: uncharacterized protein LOC107680493 [Sinocyclocheilus anshuiensis]
MDKNEYCEIRSNIHEDYENDEECDELYTKCLREENPRVDFTVSSEINKKLLKKDTWECKESISTKLSVELASATASGSGIIGMIDTIDRPADAKAEGTFARSGSYAEAFENKPGKRLPKAGVYAEAGVGRASAEFSIFRAEAKGPNASAGAEATVARLGAGAMAQAEIASASASAGPLDVKLGLGVDTGAYIGLGGVEVKLLGCGFSIGRKTSISFLGSELSFSL